MECDVEVLVLLDGRNIFAPATAHVDVTGVVGEPLQLVQADIAAPITTVSASSCVQDADGRLLSSGFRHADGQRAARR
jgi:hypothetical protein